MNTASILVVEDQKIIAKGIEKQLKKMGYAVCGLASTGEEALKMAVDLRPDLVLMDISLGKGIDGVTSAGLIQHTIGAPIVYLTANSDDATFERVKLSCPFGYVLKPYEDRDLQTAVELALYRHAVERRLRENEQWLAATLASIGDGVIAVDRSGAVRFMNSLAERLTGWTQEEAAGRGMMDVFQILDEKTRRPVLNPGIEAMRVGGSVELAPGMLLVDKLGAERAIDDSAAPIRDVDGNISGAVLVFRDVTERRRLEEHLRQAQKMEAIGRLAGGIAHDFNNIMTIVTGFTELLLDEDLVREQRQEFVRNILDASRRAVGLTQRIMAFSRRQVLFPTILNLNGVVRDITSANNFIRKMPSACQRCHVYCTSGWSKYAATFAGSPRRASMNSS
ncbi:MAG: ATP-binding response regulator, partial [Planctomycetia bacterium]